MLIPHLLEKKIEPASTSKTSTIPVSSIVFTINSELTKINEGDRKFLKPGVLHYADPVDPADDQRIKFGAWKVGTLTNTYAMNGFIASLLWAWQNHRGIALKPIHIYTLIVQAISAQVVSNPTKYKSVMLGTTPIAATVPVASNTTGTKEKESARTPESYLLV